MITRRWSEWVFAEYADDDGSLFGGGLLRVVDSRESVAAQRNLADSERVYGYNGGRPDTALATPAGPDRTPA